MATLVFCHGRESGPKGTKINGLKPVAEKHGWQVIVPDFRGIADPDDRVTYLLRQHLPLAEQVVLVGSSMGGYVALRAAAEIKPDGLLLFAPAVGLAGYAEADPRPVAWLIEVIHGWNDAIVPPAKVLSWAEKHGLNLHLVADEHSLVNSLPLLQEQLELMLVKCAAQQAG